MQVWSKAYIAKKPWVLTGSGSKVSLLVEPACHFRHYIQLSTVYDNCHIIVVVVVVVVVVVLVVVAVQVWQAITWSKPRITKARTGL